MFFFTSLLYVCIYVAPWSCEARHFVPLYEPTCSGMTIQLNLTWCPGPPAEIKVHNIKIQQYISLYTWGTFYSCVHQTYLECLLLKRLIFLVSSDHRSQSHLKLQSCLTTEYAGVCFGWARIIFLEDLPNNMWWCRGCLIIFLKVFWPRNSTFLYNSPAVVLRESLATQIFPLTVH